MKWSLFVFFLLFFFSSFGIFNLKTGEEQEPQIDSKKWVILAQKCHSCFELLVELETFCKGAKPSPKKVGFLISGSNTEAMLNKLKNFKEDYEMFAGSPGELYQHYNVRASHSLRSEKKLLSWKSSILKFLKEDKTFCS